MNIDAIVWSALLLSFSSAVAGYWIAYQIQRTKVLNNLKKNYSEYEMFRIMFHINGFKMQPTAEQSCPLINMKDKESA